MSTGTVINTCIFPQATSAFMILQASTVLDSSKAHIEHEVAANLKRFSELHHKCYVFLLAPLIGTSEQKILSLLQEEYLNTELNFLPVHNAIECGECIFSITKVLCEPLSDVIRERFRRLRDQVCSEENILMILAELGIDQRIGTILLDGCGRLSGVAKATRRGELIDYNVSSSLITSIQEVLNTQH